VPHPPAWHLLHLVLLLLPLVQWLRVMLVQDCLLRQPPAHHQLLLLPCQAAGTLASQYTWVPLQPSSLWLSP
jgi:hypothetical protein